MARVEQRRFGRCWYGSSTSTSTGCSIRTEQASARGQSTHGFDAVPGLDEATAREVWRSFVEFMSARPADHRIAGPLLFAAIPTRHSLNEQYLAAHLPSAITPDGQPGAQPGGWCWIGDTAEAGAF